MPHLKFEQQIGQLEKRKGGYFYLQIAAEAVAKFEKKRATRLICVIDNEVNYACGLNHLGDGNYYIIVASKYLKKLAKSVGDTVHFEIYEDPNPLGVEVPEVLQVLIDQDDDVKTNYENLTDGKKRSLIYSIANIKNLDIQIQKILAFLGNQKNKKRK
ncbi:MAG: DUF1905 domain-containing protein [Bacteroidota bacterium]